MTLAAPLPHPFDPAATLRVCGHFGEWLQGRLAADGPLALVSVPCPALWVEPAAQPEPGLIDARRLSVLAGALGLTPPATLPALRATMPQGGGAGSSTAALVAAARLMGFAGPPADLARACVAAEGASDPLMFDAPERLLFAPREGRVLQSLPALPAFEIVGGFWGEDRRTDPADSDFPDIADLLAQWQTAPGLPALAALASESARRTLDRRGPAGDPTAALAQRLGALGFVIAHTGSARGLVFAPGTVPPQAAATLAAAGFRGVIRFGGGGA